jgi:large subunit ribosomal protein L29
MAIIKKNKLKEMSEKEIDEKINELKLELTKEIGFSEIGTVKNPGHVGELKRTIARLLTRKAYVSKQKSIKASAQKKK